MNGRSTSTTPQAASNWSDRDISQQKAYDFVIIPCPNVGTAPGIFEEYDKNGLYIGGQVRMQAAVDLYYSPSITIGKFIVVGGGLDEADPIEQRQKTANMQQFLVAQGIPSEKIICVVSRANTLGNFRAIWVTCRKQLDGKVIGMLTNSYHLPRAMCMITDPQFAWGSAKFSPLAAELILAKPPHFPTNDSALSGRVKIEEQGLENWHHGTYTLQYAPVKTWRGKKFTALPARPSTNQQNPV